MTAGPMDQQVTLQRYAEVSDGAGGVTFTWDNYGVDAVVWANVKAKAGRESLIEGRMTATFVVVFTIYSRSDISERDRIIWDGVAYNIRGILRQTGRAITLQIEAERGVPNSSN